MIKMFCDRCGAEIELAPESETDEVDLSLRRPETGEDGYCFATVCDKCATEIVEDSQKWRVKQSEEETH